MKNAYYKNATELETLPNIDINIKCGNSLVSRFAIDADLSQALKKSKWSINSYRIAVDKYRNAESKEEKREMEKLIDDIKSDFRSEISLNDPKAKKLATLKEQIFLNSTEIKYDWGKKEKADWNKKVLQLTEESKKLETEIEEIKANKIYENAFEWRFEFPEVLNDNGDFVGFDVVIGNPPYIQQRKLKGQIGILKDKYVVHTGTSDLSVFFIEKGFSILKSSGIFSFITSNKFFGSEYGEKVREFLSDYQFIQLINFEQVRIFDEALVSTTILILQKNHTSESMHYLSFEKEDIKEDNFSLAVTSQFKKTNQNVLTKEPWYFNSQEENGVLKKLNSLGSTISTIDSIRIRMGVKTGFDDSFIINKDTFDVLRKEDLSQNIIKPFLRGRDIKRYGFDFNNLYLLFIPWHFPLQDDSNITGVSLLAEQKFTEKYPNIYNHLLKYKTNLLARNQAETGIRYEWYCLQRAASTFIEDYYKEKIIWGLISGDWNFALDNEGTFISSASYFLVSDKISNKLILGLLNSKLYRYHYNFIGEKTAGGALVFKKTTIEKFLIPNDLQKALSLIHLVYKILILKKENNSIDTSKLENQIDQLVYQLYDLTEEEIKIIETT